MENKKYSIQDTKAWRINCSNGTSYLLEIGQKINLTLKSGLMITEIIHECWSNHIEIIFNGLRDISIEDIINIQF